jgi:hypothetical protein
MKRGVQRGADPSGKSFKNESEGFLLLPGEGAGDEVTIIEVIIS